METRVTKPDTNIPRLSDEAINLFFSRGGFGCTEPVVDLRPLLALECEHGPSVIRAADRWSVPANTVLAWNSTPIAHQTEKAIRDGKR